MVDEHAYRGLRGHPPARAADSQPAGTPPAVNLDAAGKAGGELPRLHSPQSRWSDQLYGYGWWVRELAGYDAYFAWGYGGQYAVVVPGLDLVTSPHRPPSSAT